MPDGVVPNEGLARGLQWTLVNPDTTFQAWELLLFTNDITPNAATVAADLVEPSWTSYARVGLTAAAWSSPVVEDNLAVSDWGSEPVVFTNEESDTETVYGCAIFDPQFGVLRFVQRFDAGDIRPIAAGESVSIIPRLTRRGAAA